MQVRPIARFAQCKFTQYPGSPNESHLLFFLTLGQCWGRDQHWDWGLVGQTQPEPEPKPQLGLQ